MLRANRLLAVMVVGATLLAACSDSKGTALNLGTSPASTTSPTTSTAAAAVTTTAAPASTTTVVPTASSTQSSEEEQVKADFLAAMAVRRQCSYDPGACNFGAVAVPDSPMDNFLRDTMTQRVAANLRLVGTDSSTLSIVSVRIVSDSFAEVSTCIYDPVVMYDVMKVDDPTDDIVFDENAYSVRSNWKLTKSDTGWRIREGSVTEQTIGQNRCAA